MPSFLLRRSVQVLVFGMQNDGKHQPPNGILYWGWNLFFGKAAVA